MLFSIVNTVTISEIIRKKKKQKKKYVKLSDASLSCEKFGERTKKVFLKFSPMRKLFLLLSLTEHFSFLSFCSALKRASQKSFPVDKILYLSKNSLRDLQKIYLYNVNKF